MKVVVRTHIGFPRLPDWESKVKIFGLPLLATGSKPRGVIAVGTKAAGFISIGAFSRGFISLGAISMGVISFGCISLGGLAIGALAAGLLAAGALCAGIVAAGAVAIGLAAVGAVSFGLFSAGALSFGHFIAMGGYAHGGLIALGDAFAKGSVFEKVGPLTPHEASYVRDLLERVVPPMLSFFGNLFGRLAT